MSKNPLTKEEINDILDKYEYLLVRPDVVGIDIKFDDKQQPYLEIDSLKEEIIIGKTFEQKNLPKIEEMSKAEIPMQSSLEWSVQWRDISIKINSVSENYDQIKNKKLKITEDSSKLYWDRDISSNNNFSAVRPMQGGNMVSAKGINYPGTMGVAMMYRGNFCYLSNNHVLSGNLQFGNRVYQPPKKVQENEFTNVTGAEAIKFYSSIPASEPYYNLKDVAWCITPYDQNKMYVNGIGMITGRRAPVLYERVLFYGGASQKLQSAQIISLTKRYASQNDQFGISYWRNAVELDREIGIPGDSGTAYIAEDDYKVVALHRAGSYDYDGTSKGCIL